MTTTTAPGPRAARNRCPGCSRPTTQSAPWCPPCHLRIPTELRQRHHAAAAAEKTARDAIVNWLGQHPHATTRELEILALAARGHDNARIAADLHISVHTVKDAWRNLSQRWACHGRAHVIATAFQLGYLTVGVRA